MKNIIPLYITMMLLGMKPLPAYAGNEAHFMQVLAHVYMHDPRLAAEREAVKALDQGVAVAYSGFRPNASAQISYGRQRMKVDDFDDTSGTTRTRNLVIEEQLFNGFGTSAEYKAAKERVAAGRARLVLKEEQVLLEAAAAYFELAEKQRLLELNFSNNRNIRKQYLDAQKRYDAGDGTSTEVAQSESRMAEAESGLTAARAEWEKAYIAYERATGLAAGAVDFPEIQGNMPATPQEAKEKALVAPEIFISASEERVSGYEVDVADSSLWPTLSLRGSVGDEEGTTAVGSSLVRENSITLNMRIPLYQGGAEYARSRAAKNNHARLQQEKRDVERAAAERALQLWYAYQASMRIVLTAKRSADAAEHALAGVTTEQREGLRTLLDVLDAQNELLARRASEVRAQKNLRLDACRLLAATGALTAEQLSLDVPLYDPEIHYEDNATRWAGF